MRELAACLKAAGLLPYSITGEGNQRERRRIIDEARCAMESFNGAGMLAIASTRHDDVQDSTAGLPVLVATESCLGEGFDLPELTALFMATPVSYSGVVIQQVGRLHRASPGKSAVTVYDYVDLSIPQLERSYKRRLKVYASMGYKVADGSEVSEDSRGSFIEVSSWAERFIQDIEAANRTVEVFPHMSIWSALIC